MTTPPVFLINLDRNPERLETARAALAPVGIVPERVAAVDGRALPPGQLAQIEAAAMAAIGRALSPGEVGCFLSHLEAARRIVAAGLPHAIVLEDDARPGPELVADLAGLMAALPAAADLVNLGRAPSKFFRPERVLPSGRALGRAYYFPVTTSALLWSRAGAERFLAEHRLEAPVDVFLQRWLSGSGRGWACAPALFGLSGAASEIGSGAGRKGTRAAGYTALRLRRQGGNLLKAALGRLRGA